MKIVIQRVISAEFISKNELVSKIGNGIYVLVGAEQGDTMEDVDYVAKKILNCKFFNDSELGLPDDSSHRWKKSVKERGLEILIATNFTLPSSLKKGTKPNLCLALDPEQARVLTSALVEKLMAMYSPEKIKRGVFQCYSRIKLECDGPCTFLIETKKK